MVVKELFTNYPLISKILHHHEHDQLHIYFHERVLTIYHL